jgi:hypothetical protein
MCPCYKQPTPAPLLVGPSGLDAYITLAELLEQRGTEEDLAQARTLRDGIAHHLARHEARRAAAAEAVRQWREERIKAVDRR